MTESKHTPGPWRVDLDDDDYPIIGHPTWKCRRRDVAGEWEIAKVEDLFEDHEEEREANARLIAAAPDLLRVAELLVDWLDEDEGAHKLCDTARAAIAKAEGRS